MKFVILTDTHFVPRGRSLYGLDPAERLTVAVQKINATHKDISFVIVTGDLAHWGEQAAYASLAGVLAGLGAPTILMMGNHDKRAAFRAEFAGADRDTDGFVQGVHIFDAATVVTLDTLNEETPDHAGILCEARLRFLADTLTAAPTDRSCCSSTIRHSTAAYATWTPSSSPTARRNGRSSPAPEGPITCSWAICTGRSPEPGAASRFTSSAR